MPIRIPNETQNDKRRNAWEYSEDDAVSEVVLMSPSMRRRLCACAKQNSNTLHGTIRFALKKYLNHEFSKLMKRKGMCNAKFTQGRTTANDDDDV